MLLKFGKEIIMHAEAFVEVLWRREWMEYCEKICVVKMLMIYSDGEKMKML